jgi:hypothetical protein
MESKSCADDIRTVRCPFSRNRIYGTNASDRRLAAIAQLWLLVLFVIPLAIAYPNDCALAQASGASQETIEQAFTNPLTTLPQIVIRDAYSPATFGTHVQTNAVIIRPIIPRIPPYTLLPFVQLIRPTLDVVTVPSRRGGGRTEFGDTQLFDIAVLPWPNRQSSGFLFGIGPTFVFPTATSASAGQGAWQAGPALGMIYIGHPGLLVGFILQNPLSFAYTSPNRQRQSRLEIQPIFALHLFGNWYLRSAEATSSIGWGRHTPTVLPMSLGIGRSIVRPGLPPMSFFVTGQWTLYRQFAPVTPQTTVNFGMTMAFPEWREW